jgi:DNA-binding transcriptional MerR regulator
MSNDRPPQPTSGRTGDESRTDFPVTLDELCDLAGVTVRTVRYYISEGLLPPPSGHGASTRYLQEHLDRLRIIESLKEKFLPLREIRRSLDSLNAGQIRDTADLLRQSQPAAATPEAVLTDLVSDRNAPNLRSSDRNEIAFSAPPARDIREESDAASYISDVLDRGRQRRPSRHQQPRDPEPESWRRVRISDEAEFLIEEQAYQRRREQIESLVTWAKRILNGT